MNKNISIKPLIILTYIASCIIAISIVIHQIWLPYMQAKSWSYANIKSEPFNGTVTPIAYIPDWSKPKYWDKSIKFSDINTKDLIKLPKYNVSRLQNENNLVERFTYTVLYMWSYSMNYKEYDWSHLGIDIRSVLWTPIRNIANWVVVKVVNWDLTGNKYVTVRHDNVPVNWKNTTIYSNYLHLSEISVIEWTKIRKWEMVGRVWNSWISTAPHLHFQIDTADAPFHPYWPFTSAEARQNWMNTFQAVTAGLGKAKAEKYTINPMEFVQFYENWNNNSFNEKNPEVMKQKRLEDIINFTEIPETADTPPNLKLEDLVSFNESVVASQIIYNNKCNWNDEKFNKKIQELNKNECILSHVDEINPNKKLTRWDALIAIMKFYNIKPSNEISDYLDIPLSDQKLQNYAKTASDLWIFKNKYISPYKNLTKWEFLEILNRFGKIKIAPNNYKAFNDINQNSTIYKSINNYGYHINEKNKNINPFKILNQKDLVEILWKL